MTHNGAMQLRRIRNGMSSNSTVFEIIPDPLIGIQYRENMPEPVVK